MALLEQLQADDQVYEYAAIFYPFKNIFYNRENHTNLSCQHNKKMCFFHAWTGHALITMSGD